MTSAPLHAPPPGSGTAERPVLAPPEARRPEDPRPDPRRRDPHRPRTEAERERAREIERRAMTYVVFALVLVLLPAVASEFVLIQIFAWTLVLGMVALSLMFLAGYGGMVSLVQMSVAALAGYMVALLGASGTAQVSLGWSPWVAVPAALLIATAFGTLSGALAVRTVGIYTIMITLAIAAAFFYFTRQNYAIFNGFNGFTGVQAPVFWGVDWRAAIPFYYVVLALAAASYAAVAYVARSPFGLALQGTRDNPRRMAALGFDVTAHRIAAYAFASLIAAVAGVLMVWLNGQISPGTASIAAVIDILVIAVVGGLGRPIGPFIGALIYVVLRTFALDVLVGLGLDGQRFQLLIGLGFLAIVFFSPDGVIGLWDRWRDRLASPRDKSLRPGEGRAGGGAAPEAGGAAPGGHG